MSARAPWDERRYRVVSTAPVTPVIRELWLAPTADALAYRAGQYVQLEDTAHCLPPRSYSIANAPRVDGGISLLVTRYPAGPVSNWVHDVLAPGDEVVLTGPYGTFVLDDDRSPVLLLAAGSGVAPIRALATDMLAKSRVRRVTLFFSVRTAADVIDRARFEAWARAYQGFRFLLTLTREPTAPRHQRIPGLLPELLGDLHGWEVFVCGPSAFVAACAAAACAAGAAGAAVHTEEFFADPEPWVDAPPGVPGPASATCGSPA